MRPAPRDGTARPPLTAPRRSLTLATLLAALALAGCAGQRAAPESAIATPRGSVTADAALDGASAGEIALLRREIEALRASRDSALLQARERELAEERERSARLWESPAPRTPPDASGSEQRPFGPFVRQTQPAAPGGRPEPDAAVAPSAPASVHDDGRLIVGLSAPRREPGTPSDRRTAMNALAANAEEALRRPLNARDAGLVASNRDERAASLVVDGSPDALLAAVERFHDVRAEGERAAHALRANLELLDLQQRLLDSYRAAVRVAQEERRNGRLSEVELAAERAEAQRARWELVRIEAEAERSRRELARLLRAPVGAWSLAAGEPPIPVREPDGASVERSARQQWERAAADAGAQLGLTPDDARRRGEAAATEARAALDRLRAARLVVENYRDALLPMQGQIIELSLQRYDAGAVSAYDLLRARRDELRTRAEYARARRDYWLARVDVERALGGQSLEDIRP